MTKIINGYASQMKAPVRQHRVNLKYFNLCLFGLIGALGVAYLISASNLAVLGFSLRDLKSQYATLASAKLENEETVNAAQSYYSLSARTKGLGMVAVGDVEYLSPTGNVALAK